MQFGDTWLPSVVTICHFSEINWAVSVPNSEFLLNEQHYPAAVRFLDGNRFCKPISCEFGLNHTAQPDREPGSPDPFWIHLFSVHLSESCRNMFLALREVGRTSLISNQLIWKPKPILWDRNLSSVSSWLGRKIPYAESYSCLLKAILALIIMIFSISATLFLVFSLCVLCRIVERR